MLTFELRHNFLVMAENLRTAYQHRVQLDSPRAGNRVPVLQKVFSVRSRMLGEEGALILIRARQLGGHFLSLFRRLMVDQCF